MMQHHDPAWLADVRRPGPNPITSHTALLPETETFIMQDDVTVSEFIPGAAAYAGYWNGSFANMTAVRAFAKAHGNARTFAYTPDGDLGADGLDIEPGDSVPADAPKFYNGKGGKGVYLYGSASWVAGIISTMTSAGISRDKYKIISAHYIGQHICGPSTCGYPQADATQFTDAYEGRSLDATLYTASFFGEPAVSTSPSWAVWVTAGQGSLAQLAAKQKTTVTQILEHTIAHYSGNLPMNISIYLNAGNLNAIMPAGLELCVPGA